MNVAVKCVSIEVNRFSLRITKRNVTIFQMRQAFLTLSHLKVPRLVIIFRDKKRWSCSNFPESGSKLFVYLREFRKKNNSDVSFICFRSKCHNAPFSLCKLTYLTSYLGTLTFHKVQTIFFLNTLIQSNNL